MGIVVTHQGKDYFKIVKELGNFPLYPETIQAPEISDIESVFICDYIEWLKEKINNANS